MNKLLLIVGLICIGIAGNVIAQNMPSKDQLPPGQWNQISPGGDTICGHGAPYSFYYRDGPGQDLLIDFQGGGMCWNGQTCSPTADKTFDDFVNPGDPSDNPALFPVGITDFSNPDNPFINYDMVYVDYCTGDMHTGSKTQGLTYNNSYYDVKFNGYVNAQTVLNWVYANIPKPDSVFVTGCSAGSIGAAYWSADIAAHYRGKRVSLLGDSGGGWRGGVGVSFNLWGSSYQGTPGKNLTIEQFYAGAARAGVHVAEYNTANDETQNFFNYVGFSTTPYTDALRLNLRTLVSRARGFRSYTEGGNVHCVIPRGEFYTYQTNGVRLRDWVADLAIGKPIRSITCTDCDTPGVVGQ